MERIAKQDKRIETDSQHGGICVGFIGAVGIVLFLATTIVRADAPNLKRTHENELDRQRRMTAVTLNYCRASFHRIKQAPTKRVLLEEREKILNNLDLNSIADAEVMKLYGAVLSEISQVQIADEEREFIRKKFKRVVTHQIVGNAFEFGMELAGAQYLDALRTGTRSWWDYRSSRWNRDLDTWQVEKTRMKDVVGKSSLFLDTFWKLAHKRQIPDRWLVRNSDLDKLEQTLLEPDPEVRLRVLARMEPFMECYPPYWYYTARTQQATGKLTAAEETYRKLAELGDGQFRKDEMLAAGSANLASILEHLRKPGAVKSAQQALRYSTEAWEVNLTCARVLKNHLRYNEAEDAILRNLDVDLEREHSTTQLVSLYVESENKQKLIKRLNDKNSVRLVSMPVLLQAAAFLGTEQLPQPALAQLGSSLSGYPDLRFGQNDFVIIASPSWRLHNARLSLKMGDRTLTQPEIKMVKQYYLVRFRRVATIGKVLNRRTNVSSLTLAVNYPHMQEIRLQLAQPLLARNPQSPRVAAPLRFNRVSASLLPKTRRVPYRLASIELGKASLAFATLNRPRSSQADSSKDVLTTPAIPVSVTADKGPVITPTYVLSESTVEELLSDESNGVSIRKVHLVKPASSEQKNPDEESDLPGSPPSPAQSPTTELLPQPPGENS